MQYLTDIINALLNTANDENSNNGTSSSGDVIEFTPLQGVITAAGVLMLCGLCWCWFNNPSNQISRNDSFRDNDGYTEMQEDYQRNPCCPGMC